jgi:hypothetical protein
MTHTKRTLDAVISEIAVVTFAHKAARGAVIDVLTLLMEQLFALQQAVPDGLGPGMACQVAALHLVEAGSKLDPWHDDLLVEGLRSIAREIVA